MSANKVLERLGKEKINKQGCLMRIIEYPNANNIVVEFQDKYKARVHTNWDNFEKGVVKNPYYPSLRDVGVVGTKYKTTFMGIKTKEYQTWDSMIRRCFDKKTKERHPTYKDVICCEEWLNFENFYEWLHSQENFDNWLSGEHWNLDKDIIVKGNKLYSPNTCFLVPHNVNSLFVKQRKRVYDVPIGIIPHGNGFSAWCRNPFTNKGVQLGTYPTIEEAFFAYKEYKENIIKQVAKIEYRNGNITKRCYDAMMSYIVEIND